MKPQPIVFLVGPFPPPQGGVATINEQIYKACDQKHYRIRRHNTSEHKYKYQIRSVTGALNLFFQIVQLVKFFIRIFRDRPAIIHVAVSSYLGFYKSALFILTGALFKKKIILHLHGGAFARFYSESHPLIQKYIRLVFKKSSQIITLADSWKKIVTQMLPIPPAKVIILHNCYGQEFEQLPAVMEQLEARREADSVIKILYVGALNQKKGVLDLVAICAEIKKEFGQFILYIAGGEKEAGLIDKIHRTARELKVADKIHLSGEISGQKKLDHFLKCHVFILPSYVENFPVAILEAMRAGMPVVATPVGAIPEMIRDEENGFLVQAGDIKQFATKITKLCRDKSLRQSISRKNLNTVLKSYSPEQFKIQLNEIYRQAIDA